MTDYQTLYRELQARCAGVAEKLRHIGSAARDYAAQTGTWPSAAVDPAFLVDLADTLDTPIAASEAATRLAFDANEPFENEEA